MSLLFPHKYPLVYLFLTSGMLLSIMSESMVDSYFE